MNIQSRKTPEVPRQRLSQKLIIETAADLFARNGYGGTTLDDIAKVLGVQKGALYYHIKNKEEILRLIVLTVLNVSEEPLRQIVETELPADEKLRRVILHHSTVAADRSPAMTVFYREQSQLVEPFAQEILLRKKAYERLIERVVEEGAAAGIFRRDLDPKIVTFGLLGMCNWLSTWYKAGHKYTAVEIGTMFSLLLEQGLHVGD